MADSLRHGTVLVLVGGALPPDIVAEYSIVSAAAARQQMGFAAALAAEFETRAVCLSYLPVGDNESLRPWTIETADGIEIRVMPRSRSAAGTLRYFVCMMREARRLRGVSSTVFCYNALVWTTPWAYLLSRLSNAPLILMVADLDPDGEKGFWRRAESYLENFFLRSTKKFMIFSAETRALLPRKAASEVFSGIADELALAEPDPTYGERVRFTFAGSLNPHAGVTTYVEAAAIVAERDPRCEFHIFGRGTLKVAIPITLGGRLVVHGFVSDEELDRFFQSDSVGVNPRPAGGLSLHNAPYKLIYYLSRGIITITTDTPGVQSDLLELCVVAGDSPESLADAMQSVIAMTPAERSGRALKGRRAIAERRSRAAFGAAMRRLLGDQPRSAR